jgi:Flp pilus assembly protein TadB
MGSHYSPDPGIRLIRLPRWAAALALLAAVSLGLLLLVLAAGLALVIIPVALVGGLILRWRLRRRTARARQPADVIDVEYRIIDRER